MMASSKGVGFAAMVQHVKASSDATQAVQAVQALGFTYRWAAGWHRHVSAMVAAGCVDFTGIAYTGEANVKAGTVQAAMVNGTWAVLALDGHVLAVGGNAREALAAYAVKRGTGEYHARANTPAHGEVRRGEVIAAAVSAGVLTANERAAGKAYTLTAKQQAAREARALAREQATAAREQATAARASERAARASERKAKRASK